MFPIINFRFQRIILGVPLIMDGRPFDPGKQGSYFQAPATVLADHNIIRGIPDLAPISKMLERAALAGQALYVTF